MLTISRNRIMTIGTKVKYFNEHGKVLGTGIVGNCDIDDTLVITDGSYNGNLVEVIPNKLVKPLSELELSELTNKELQNKFDHLRGTLALLSEFSVNDATKSTLIKVLFDWVAEGGTLPLDLLTYIADNT